MVESLVVVILVKEGEPADTANVPLVAGMVIVTVCPSVAWMVALPEVAPAKINGILFP
jgi:hypothetical protein